MIADARRRRWNVGKLRSALDVMPPDAWVWIAPKSGSSSDRSPQVIVSIGFCRFTPSRPLKPNQPNDRVSDVLTIETDFGPGEYCQPVTEAEDRAGWIRGREIVVTHKPAVMTAGNVVRELDGLPDRLQIQVLPQYELQGILPDDELFLSGIDADSTDHRKITLTGEALPLKLSLEASRPQGWQRGPSLTGGMSF